MSSLQIIRPKEAADLLGIAISTLYRWSEQPDFPKRIKIGKRASGWRRSDLEEWLDQKANNQEEVA